MNHLHVSDLLCNLAVHCSALHCTPKCCDRTAAAVISSLQQQFKIISTLLNRSVVY
jgi:hypothetical protein